MKRLINCIILNLIISQAIFAQDITTVEAKSSDISDNLDLEVVASIFGESENLEDFEYKLNDPQLKISNLDLNGDGYVDYLRVVENSEDQTILITIQAVLGDDIYQDVATIDVEKDERGKTYVQVVGDVYMYGPDYIIEPVYMYSPPVVLLFWEPSYRRWHSPYYWHHYPSNYYAWNTCAWHDYHNHVHAHVNINHKYYYPHSRRSVKANYIYSKIRRSDYARTYPDRSFSSRNTGVRNTHELNERRGTAQRATGTRAASSGRTSNSRTGNATTSNRSGSAYSSRKSEGVNKTNVNKTSRNGTSQVRSGQSRNNSSREAQNRKSYNTQSRSGQGQARHSKASKSVEKRNVKSGERSSGRSGSNGSSSSKSNSSSSNSKGKGKRR